MLRWHFEQQGIDLSQGPKLGDVIAVQAERVKNLKEMATRLVRYFL